MNENSLIQKIFQYLKKNNQTLCTAESCTGGFIAHSLTNIHNSSHFFVGGIVSYSDSSKTHLLEVPEKLLKSKGAVNKETARLMAIGVKSLLKAHWSLSITGYMDTGQEPGKVFVGVVGPKIQDIAETTVTGSNRMDLKYQSLVFSLNFLISKFTSLIKEVSDDE